MSDTETLDAMRTKLRELELDHVQLAGRIMELNECIALVENGPRRRPGRQRRIEAVEVPNGQHGVAQVNSQFQAPPWAGSGHDPKDALK